MERPQLIIEEIEIKILRFGIFDLKRLNSIQCLAPDVMK